jgi:predicted flap endonuclease-1-like 5' DNA nuclease
MFEESPFTGACAYAMWEVIVMLVGTLALGMLLGYLIWGWTRRKLLLAEKRIADLEVEVGLLDEQRARLETIERKQRIRAASWAARALVTNEEELPEQVELPPPTVFEQPEVFPMAEPGEESFEVIRDPEQALADEPDPGLSAEQLRIASEIMGREVRYNDLQLIEGIGPVIAEVLMRGGITSWKKLAGTTKHILRVILDEAGPQYRIHKPKTWPKQARMAVDGEWKKLKAYQDTLIGGK